MNDSVPRKKVFNQVTYTFQGELVRAKVSHPKTRNPVRPGGDRKPITEFTPRSRKTLLETFARIDWTGTRTTFLTLTYHNRLPTAREAKTHLRTFLKRVFRRFGSVPVAWRLERQKRGAWHFHLILWDMDYYPVRECLADWRAATGDDTITNIKIEALSGPKMIRRYLSKYVAKPGVVVSNLDTVANLAVDDEPGRFWGIENRKEITWAELVSIVTSDMTGLHDFKRAARHYWKGINGSRDCGFSLFCNDANQWFDLALFYLG